MFKIVLRILIYVTVISFMVCAGMLSSELKHIDGCTRQFRYTDINGNKGIAQYCYTDSKGKVCKKNIKEGIRTTEYKEERKCN